MMAAATSQGLEVKEDTNTGDDPQPNLATTEVKTALAGLMKTFEEFKSSNDARLKAIEKKRADVLDEERTDRNNAEIDKKQAELDKLISEAKALAKESQLRDARPMLVVDGEKRAMTDDEVKHRDVFRQYMRKGVDPDNFDEIAMKALSVGSDPDGGRLAPVEVDNAIAKNIREISGFRQNASVITISGSGYKKPYQTGTAAAGWVGETESRTETDTPDLGVLEFPVHEIYAMPAATRTLLEDANVNIEQWLADEVRETFAEKEGRAFVKGLGAYEPRGFLEGGYTKVANGSWTDGSIGYIATGTSGGFDADNPADKLIDLVYAPKASYRANGRFMMNRATQAVCRKFKDGQDNYLWQPNAQAGQPASLLGYSIIDDEEMPDLAANSFSVAFGDFRRGYLIVDRRGIEVLRDPFTSKPYILFYTTKRVGGGVQNFEAFKLLKFGTS
jgi:HK97 family phage major capsid protein